MKHIKSIALLILVSLILVSGSLSACTAIRESAALIPGPDFEELAYVDLSSQSFEQEILGQFAVQETADVTLRYVLPNVDTSYFDLSLITPDGDSLTVLHSENFRTDVTGGGTWQENLAPGTYQLALTTDVGQGALTVYWKAAH